MRWTSMIDKWTVTKNVLNELLAGGRTEKRSYILDHMPRGMRHTTFDCYLNYLHKAGYLMKPRRGWYRLADGQIPTDLTISDVKSQAYGIVDFDGARRVIDFDDTDRIRNRIVGEQRHSDQRHDPPTFEDIQKANNILPDWRV